MTSLPDSRDRAGALDHQLVLETFSDAVVAATDDNRIVFVNHTAEALLGWSSDDLVGRPLTTIIPQRLHHAHMRGFTRYLETREAVLMGRRIRVPALRRDGTEVETELTISAADTRDGRVLLVGSLRDVRGTVALERETEASRRLLGVIAEATSLGGSAPLVLATLGETLDWDVTALWVPDPHDDRLVCVELWHSPEVPITAFERQTRQTRLAMGEGLPGQVWESRQPVWLSDVTETANFPRIMAAQTDGLRGGFGFPLTSGSRFLGVIEQLSREPRHRDGQLLTTIATLAAPLGQFIERRMVQEALEASRARLDLALRAADMGTWEWDAASGAVSLSETAERILGFRADNADEYLHHVHPDDYEAVGEAMRRSIEENQEYHVEHRFVRPDGTIRWIESRGRALPGPVTTMAGVLTDVTERKRAEVEQERLQHERLHIAEVLQRSLLPPDLPKIPGVEVSCRYRAAGRGEVGGDFYDVFPVRGTTWGVAIGDVQGKGPEAAAITALVRYSARAAAMHVRRPERVLGQLNAALLGDGHQTPESRFCTMVFARLQRRPDGAQVTFANAGHPPPLLVRASGDVEEFSGQALPLGTFPDATYRGEQTTLRAGDALVLYTDGITEARVGPRLFGERRLRALLSENAGRSADDMAGRVLDAVLRADPSPRDDIALLVLRASGLRAV